MYIRDMVILRLDGNAIWDEVQLDDDIELETYRVTTEPGGLIVEPVSLHTIIFFSNNL